MIKCANLFQIGEERRVFPRLFRRLPPFGNVNTHFSHENSCRRYSSFEERSVIRNEVNASLQRCLLIVGDFPILSISELVIVVFEDHEVKVSRKVPPEPQISFNHASSSSLVNASDLLKQNRASSAPSYGTYVLHNRQLWSKTMMLKAPCHKVLRLTTREIHFAVSDTFILVPHSSHKILESRPTNGISLACVFSLCSTIESIYACRRFQSGLARKKGSLF